MPLSTAIELALPLIREYELGTVPDDILRYRVGTAILPSLIRIPFWGQMAPEQQAALIAFAWDTHAGFYGNNYYRTINLALQTKDWERMPEILRRYVGTFGNKPWRQYKRRWQEAKLWEQGLLVACHKDIIEAHESDPVDNVFWLSVLNREFLWELRRGREQSGSKSP